MVRCKSIGDQEETHITEMAMRCEDESLDVSCGKLSNFWLTVLAVCQHVNM